ATGHQLERACGNFSTGLGHTDNDGLAQAAVAAFQRLTHNLGVANALEGIVNAAIGQLNDVIHHVFDLVRVHEMGHAEFTGHGFACRVQINANDFIGAHHFGPLDHVQANATQPEHHDVR